MLVTLKETIKVSPEEIRILKRLHKKGKSFLYLPKEIINGTKDELIGGLKEKGLIESRYYIGGINTGHYWYISSKGRKVLKLIDEIREDAPRKECNHYPGWGVFVTRCRFCNRRITEDLTGRSKWVLVNKE